MTHSHLNIHGAIISPIKLLAIMLKYLNFVIVCSYLMKRLFDILFATILITILALPFLFIWCAIRLTSKGPAIYWSDRMGRNNVTFRMPKFRSMRIDSPVLATHLLYNPKAYITPIGFFLRKTSLDELPQLWSILRGDMSFVGPRPALFNQHDLIKLRTELGINQLLPGLTGWAQVNGRDELEIPRKVALDAEYMKHQSLYFDIWILCLTAKKVISHDNVSH